MTRKWQHKKAFVIRFENEIDLTNGKCAGRVEHVDSCRATHFRTLDELLSFLSRVMKEVSVLEQTDLDQK